MRWLVCFLLFPYMLSAQVAGSGYSLSFLGGNYVDLHGDYENLIFPITVCGWVQSKAITQGPVFSSYSGGGGYSGVWVRVGSNKITLAHGSSHGFSHFNRQSKVFNISISPGTWFHLAGQFISPGNMKLYVNGVEVSGYNTGTGVGYYEAPVGSGNIGRCEYGPGWIYHYGDVDDLSIWNKLLTPTEIRNSMSSKLSGNEVGLLGYYRFDDGLGTILMNEITGGTDGTLQNNPTWITSSAAIGNTSSYTYSPTGTSTTTSFTTTLTDGTQVEVENINPPVEGVQVYEVSQSPNSTAGLPAGANVQSYFGVFLAKTDMTVSHTYDLRIVNQGAGTIVFSRRTNSETQWNQRATTVQGSDILVQGDQDRQEYLLEEHIPISCDESENYDNLAAWVKDNSGSEIVINNSSLQFQDAIDGSNKRIYRKLNQPVEGDCWSLRFDILPQSGGVNQVSGHQVIALTEGNDCPLNTCNSVNTNFSLSSESGILVTLGTPRNNPPLGFSASSKLGTSRINSSIIEVTYGTHYYVEVKRVDSSTATLSVFSDPAFQQHVTGSPVSFNVHAQIDKLNYMQHSVAPQGHPDRRLTATLDNVCVSTDDCKCQIDLDLGADIIECDLNNETLQPLKVNNNYNYTWSTGETSNNISVSSPGTYWLTVDSADCHKTDTIHVIKSVPGIDPFKPIDTTICKSAFNNLVLDQFGYQFRWPDGTVGNSYPVFSTGLIPVEVMGPCDTTTQEIWVELLDCDCEIRTPNVFTPNGDGINDSFELDALCDLKDFHLQVYNRWGTLIFESRSINNSWDGTVNGNEATQGVYYYVLMYTTMEKTRSEKGFVTLFR